MKRRLCALLLALAAALCLCVPALAAGSGFDRVNAYRAGQFSDVPAGIWCSENVKSAYEFGIMKGRSEDYFDVDGSLTVAETLAMACRIHRGYAGGSLPAEAGSGVWYEPYVEYAKEHGMLWDYVSYDSPVSRADFAAIMDSALAGVRLPVISSIEDGAIPDVPEGASCRDAVYRLYGAGILTGSDSRGSFLPDSSIKRGEAAALVSRIADPGLRKAISLTKASAEFTPVPVSQLQNYASLKKNCTDEEFQAAYDRALELVRPLAGLDTKEQLAGIASALRQLFDSGMSYSDTDAHYNDPYGYFVLGYASCAGCARATGLCLNILGISYEHVNENQWSHQWCRVQLGSEFWICDAYGLYCGPEPAPYAHPYL